MGGGFPMGPGGGLQSLQSPEMMEQAGGETDMGSPDHCGTCKFFSPTDGRCLRNPPMGKQWSMVGEDDWCGCFEAGEPHMPHMDVNAQQPQDQGMTEESSFA